MEKEYRNIGFLFLLFIPLTFLGFYKTYLLALISFAIYLVALYTIDVNLDV